ncbi:mechanosensitive ion channel family protein [Aequorivita marina]|uniref:mechanosensitive ion channel family protein n=1 Tax=Aequorivita marina TaxID=3073654 RepID=UPI0028742914|nr:mechanosensitive ion channel domain-containing protein [Aequorivita sp. S2608]MDS1297814.1 mechanosensitive ion channel [Aequorivita sp. S2608]
MNTETLQAYSRIFQDYLIKEGMTYGWAVFINVVVNCIIAFSIIAIIDLIFKKTIVQAFKVFTDKTASTFDDYLVKSNFPNHVAHLIPLIIIWGLIPIIFEASPLIIKVLFVAAKVCLVVLAVLIFRSVLRSLRSFLEENERYGDKPLESYVQVLMIFAWGIGSFFIINLITGYSIISVATLGAASAVILLIFKDTILGFVASIQVSVNDIVRIGDWITFQKFGADGFVTEINLATVRVKNWDNTFTTIPTYSLIADSFLNWRGMEESDGRRIKRSIYIKQSSIKFLSEEDIKRFKKIGLVKSYIEHRQKDIDNFNELTEANKEVQINGRNQTNLGVFRYYIDAFLNANTAINKDMTLMVRPLAPTDKGVPIEIYCFSKDKRWVNYEHIQADIFDHLLAATSHFDLEIFELPSGNDFKHVV